MTHQRPHLRRSAFTLMEVVLASGIIALLLVAVQSVIILTAHAIPGAQSKATTLVSAAGVLTDLDSDLAFATAITSQSATAITFQVPDRNGDSSPETITWSWDGIPGSSLYRTYNNRTPVAVHSNVQSFSLAYDTRAVLGTAAQGTGSETLLASNALVTGIGAPPANARSIDDKNSYGQYLLPTLPANATAWSITRIQFMLRSNGNSSIANVYIKPTDTSDLPSATITDTASVNFNTIPGSFAWTQFTFSQATNLSPSAGVAIIIDYTSGNHDVGDIESQNTSGSTIGNILSSSDGGSTWNQSPNNAKLLYYVYGTITTPNPPPTLYYLTGVRAALRTSVDLQSTARASIRIINEPQVPGP